MDTQIVIMAGGGGSRLYPLSTPERPKQFLDLLDCGKTLIRLTYERFLEVDPQAHFWVVTSEKYIHFVKELIPKLETLYPIEAASEKRFLAGSSMGGLMTVFVIDW